MTIDKPEKFENEVLNQINDILDIKMMPDGKMSYSTRLGLEHNANEQYIGESTINEMSYLERCFLNGIIRQTKPKKILELGVSAGGSSAIILNAIKDFDNAKLYSVDYSKKWYRDNSKNTGFIIDEKFNNLKNKWKLYTEGTAAKFMDEIGDEIDLCLIDTMHINPGEFLDFLIVLPYLKKNAILILHDIGLYHFDKFGVTNGILFSCLKGKKLSFNEGLWNSFANIGAVILDENIKDNILDYLYLLTLPFEYLPTDNDIWECQKLFSKNYEEEFVDTFMNIMLKNKQLFIERNTISNDRLDNKVNKLIDTLAWWIPVRKWRDNFRNKFKI